MIFIIFGALFICIGLILRKIKKYNDDKINEDINNVKYIDIRFEYSPILSFISGFIFIIIGILIMIFSK